ncbi:MAG: fibronectin type III domain-containing protein [Phycisphaerales bacterium]|nr:fibronectin type III domain-containing protein [Phycisphaerales bacterium]
MRRISFLVSCVSAVFSVGAASAQSVRSASGHGDAPIASPAHPPLHLIRPMPMPIGTPDDAPAPSNALRIYNGSTGEWHDLPLGDFDPGRIIRDDSFPGFFGCDDEADPRGWGSMDLVTDLEAWPNRANCKLVMRFVDQQGHDQFFMCSGSMGDGGVVVTAGHCVFAHSPEGIDIFDAAREVWVYAAWDGGTPASNPPTPDSAAVVQRYGWARGTELLIGSAWIDDEDSRRDAACVRLNRLNTRHVGHLTGWYGATSELCDFSTTYRNFSYPAATCDAGQGLHNGRDMYFWSGGADLCTAHFIEVYVGTGCFNTFWGGMSGSGVYRVDNGAERVNAVLTHHTTSGIKVGRSTRLWDQFVTDMQDFEKDTRGVVFDLQALRYRTNGPTSIQAGFNLAAGTVVISNVSDHDQPSQNYTARLYLSANNNITSGDTLLGTFGFSGSFDGIETRAINVPAAMIPLATAPGEYWVGIVLDDASDTNTTNNDTDTWDAQRITVTACPTVPPPQNVKASDGDNCDEITVTWNASPGATQYRIYRNTADNYAGADSIGISTGTSFVDSTNVYSGIDYWYWVRAQGSCGLSEPSESDPGFIDGTPNDLCDRAIPLLGYSGSASGDITCAATDGDASCDGTLNTRDAWHLFLPLADGVLRVSTCGTHDDPGVDQGMDTVLSIHKECPGTVGNEMACNDDWAGFPPCFGDAGVRRDSLASVHINKLQTVYIRVAYAKGQLKDGRYNINWLFTPDCKPDINEDGFVNGDDFDAFAEMFDLGAIGADYNHDGFVNGDDFDEFANDFENGC